MSADTSIEWTDKTWNPVRGCSVVSPGCHRCFAARQAHRFSADGQPYAGLTKLTKAGPQWTGQVATVEDALLQPLRWKTPQRIFVNSMSDLFHDEVPDAFIDRVFAVMAFCPHHTFQVLTKRPARMLAYLSATNRVDDVYDALYHAKLCERGRREDDLICRGMDAITTRNVMSYRWPLPNVWLGVSVEDQQRADERIPLLLQTPAAVRFLSCEPLLGSVDIARYLGQCDEVSCCGSTGCEWCDGTGTGWRKRLHWVIVGGESGPGARPCDVAWVRSLLDQCRDAGVSAFVKQVGSRPTLGEKVHADEGWSNDAFTGWHRSGVLALDDRKGGDITEWPSDLRVREFPRVPEGVA